MDSDKIDALLEKYWDCQTTLEEERQLQEHFATSQVPESLKEAAALFQYFRNEQAVTLRDNAFDTKVITRIKRPSQRVAALIRNSLRIAAGIAVLILATWLVRLEVRKSSPAEYADTYNDPDKAFEETKRALMMISRSFNTAKQEAKKINVFNEAQEEIRAEREKQQL